MKIHRIEGKGGGWCNACGNWRRRRRRHLAAAFYMKKRNRRRSMVYHDEMRRNGCQDEQNEQKTGFHSTMRSEMRGRRHFCGVQSLRGGDGELDLQFVNGFEGSRVNGLGHSQETKRACHLK